MSKFPNIQPLGQMTVTAPGTTTNLSINCGLLGGGASGSSTNPPLPGSALRAIVLQSTPNTNVGNVYLLPRGSTFAANPGNVIAVVSPGQTVAIPYTGVIQNGILPENFVLDADTAGNVVFGYGMY
jgi:hypothetical protein